MWQPTTVTAHQTQGFIPWVKPKAFPLTTLAIISFDALFSFLDPYPLVFKQLFTESTLLFIVDPLDGFS